MKTILGLDLGTNSIGWALINQDFENSTGKILGMGSRIIPMSQDILGEFGKGNSISQTAERTSLRGVRRLRERFLLRRERLHRVLNLMNFLPEHYSSQIDFEKRLGKFKNHSEPKIAYDEGKFLFLESFEEMISEFKKTNPELLIDKNGKPCKIPHDWTIYYLRKKAITAQIKKNELAWIILNFNQKRGYYQLRGEEEEEKQNKEVEFYTLKVADVIADEPQKGKPEIWYSVILENGWIYRRASKNPIFDWKDKVKDFIVTTEVAEDGSVVKDKEGKEKRSFRAPSEDDWTLLKKKTEKEIENSKKSVGEFIFEELLINPKQKIKGKLVRTIERKFYKDELIQILNKQKEFYSELNNEDLLSDAIRELYRNNDSQQAILTQKDFTHLFVEDIIFYQRPLRSQKSSISNCSLEYRPIKDENGKLITSANGKQALKPLKCIHRSNPYFQEFRIWKWMSDLSIFRNEDELNVTNYFLNTSESFERLFDFLNSRKEIEEKPLLKFLLEEKGLKSKALSVEIEKYRWNFVKDKKYPCNETRTLIQNRLSKIGITSDDFLSSELEQNLWHILYSVNDKIEFEKALKTFAKKHSLPENDFFEVFKRFPPFKSEYGSYSEKAIKKLLPLMRIGKYWKRNNIDKNTIERISKIITGEYDESIKDRVREKARNLGNETDFQGLPDWLAKYIVYDRHSEASNTEKWNDAADIDQFLKEFRQHSLRNPIVEQVLTETLRVVKDIWNKYGNGAKDFFNEIHIELGREMKNTAEDRKNITNQVTENENTNLRIKALLAELFEDKHIQNVRPYSPNQQEALKIFEEYALNNEEKYDAENDLFIYDPVPEDISKISKTAQPSKTELVRYKLWLEQRYRSPYTGRVIPLSKLFSSDFEIEHIIPQSRYFDDSFSNKVICESAVNKLKDNQTGLEFIKNHHGETVDLGKGQLVRILEVSEYQDFVKQHYEKSRSKRNKLLMEEIPEKMIERQMNDTRYISKYVTQLLSNIVRENIKDEGINSKNIIPANGKITDTLKQDWGFNDIWNDLILPRFVRLNEITKTDAFTVWNDNHQKLLPTVPIEFSKGFSRKRIDHRHHAMDALVIACTTRGHVNFMNNEHALRKGKSADEKQKIREDLRNILCYKKFNGDSANDYKWIFKKPWEDLTQSAKSELEKIIVSFKKNNRVINKASNRYFKYIEVEGLKTKEKVDQKGMNWAIRKSLHKDTVSGLVNLPRVKVPKGKILTATRKSLDTSFNLKTIESITDTGIQKILKNYLNYKGGFAELAFTPEGIEDMNKNIKDFNDGKYHQPIKKVRIFEMGSKFPLGQTGNKKDKYVEAAKGTNLFFAIYQNEEGKRSFETIPLNEVIERQKQGLSPVPEKNKNHNGLLFLLSPNDIVSIKNIFNKIEYYRFVSCTSGEGHFVPHNYSKEIIKNEMGTNNKSERPIISEGFDKSQTIKDKCFLLTVSRLGDIE
ncbi:MAG: type II CRISPR RNA-guided endonuclease Cas9 [Bacteroidetes bacterium]|nr:type II CRISPR RNA-guided endonuclease Cas9 [Bacteroidota bacterium]